MDKLKKYTDLLTGEEHTIVVNLPYNPKPFFTDPVVIDELKRRYPATPDECYPVNEGILSNIEQIKPYSSSNNISFDEAVNRLKKE